MWYIFLSLFSLWRSKWQAMKIRAIFMADIPSGLQETEIHIT